MSLPAVPAIQQLQGAVVDQAGVLKAGPSQQYFTMEQALLSALAQQVSKSLGVNLFTLAAQPSLGVADAGYVGLVTDYAHLVYWDGAAWQWLDGDRPGRFSDFSSAPGTGWGLCDGSVYALLQVGGLTMTTANFTTPNLAGTPAYRKSAAAYSGAVNAASGATTTGTTGVGTTGTGTTGTGTGVTSGLDATADESSHTHPQAGTSTFNVLLAGGGASSVVNTLNANTGTGSAHHHTIPAINVAVPGLSVPGLSVPGLSVPALGVGTLDMPNLGVLPYVRR